MTTAELNGVSFFFLKTPYRKDTTRGSIMHVRVGIFLNALAIIVLAWLKEEEDR